MESRPGLRGWTRDQVLDVAAHEDDRRADLNYTSQEESCPAAEATDHKCQQKAEAHDACKEAEHEGKERSVFPYVGFPRLELGDIRDDVVAGQKTQEGEEHSMRRWLKKRVEREKDVGKRREEVGGKSIYEVALVAGDVATPLGCIEARGFLKHQETENQMCELVFEDAEEVEAPCQNQPYHGTYHKSDECRLELGNFE